MRCHAWVLMVVCGGLPGGIVRAEQAPHSGELTRRPNVLFLLTDDQRADTIGALGNPVIRTPHLDQLARRGLVFRNAYCLGSNSPAVCLPSRNMLLSGRYYFRWAGQNYASGDQPNFPDSLRQVGYETWHVGKRGNTAREIHRRFEHSQYVEDEQCRTSGEHGQQCVDRAIAFLRSRQTDRPFFMYLALEGPHDPRVAAEHYLRQYDRARIPVPPSFLPEHPFDNGELTVRDEQLEQWPRTPAAIQRHLHEYYACITSIDGHIGRLLQTLRELGEYERTLIVFSADNGLAIGAHGLMGKQNLYDDGMQVPLILCGPGIAPGQSDALVYLLDIYPTVCELVGAPPPPGIDGRSLAGVVAGRDAGVRDTLFLAYRDVQRAVRDARWKLIVYPHCNQSQLFDLQTDPWETRNLSSDSAQRERLSQLLQRMREWQREVGDTLPLPTQL